MGSFLTEVEGFTPIIDVLVAEVGLTTAAVYGVAWRFCQMKDGVCKASQETIGERLGIGRETVSIHLQRLSERGYLEDTTPEAVGKPHIYRDTGKAKIVALLSAQPVGESSTLEPVGKSDTTCRKIPQVPVGKSDTKIVIRENKDTKDMATKKTVARKGRALGPISGMYKDKTKAWPNAQQEAAIESTVKDVPLFAKTIDFWLMSGWNPKNVQGMLDMYAAGGPKSNGKGKRNDRPVEPDLRDSQRYIDDAQAYVAKHGGEVINL